jgi:predicted pyridoxine 5'-phosphate oxidase superfamily flavin-nucleotide-binding protein
MLIEKNPVAVATVDAEGKPNVIAVAFVKALSDNTLLITDNYMNQTKENLMANSYICLAVWDKQWKGLKLVGTATYHADGEWLDRVKQMTENGGLPAKGAVVVTVGAVIKLS